VIKNVTIGELPQQKNRMDAEALTSVEFAGLSAPKLMAEFADRKIHVFFDRTVALTVRAFGPAARTLAVGRRIIKTIINWSIFRICLLMIPRFSWLMKGPLVKEGWRSPPLFHPTSFQKLRRKFPLTD
jgi:hypothetical protein